ncbi:hypothetical protein CF319_g1854 [Tilletia indica]|nr:hypothetical protein CF319_g1854 [Tilletia indica]
MSGMNEGVLSLGRKVLLISAIHRSLCLLLLLFLIPSIHLSPPFDSSSLFLTAPQPRSLGLHSILERLVRWDAVHFVHIAHSGYSLEHLFAFQPGLPALLRITGSISSLNSNWDASQAVLLTTIAAFIAATLSPWLLFHLTWRHSASPSLAFLSALLSIFSPAPATLVAPSPEAFFSVFTLLGLVTLSPRLPSRQSASRSSAEFAVRFLVAALAFAVATTFRANGVLLAGFLAWNLWWETGSKTTPAVLRIAISPLILIPTLPFVFFQIWAKSLFCNVPDIATQRPWCSDALPNLYAFVQREYWNVGFLRYWEPSQLPNFLLAAPVLVFAVYGSIKYSKGSLRPILFTLLLQADQSKSDTRVEKSTRVEAPATSMHMLHFSSSPTLLPHVIHNIITVGLLLFVSHVQIALRFATPGGMPIFWWGLAGWVLKGNRSDSDPSSSSGRVSNSRLRTVLGFLVMWNVLSLALYSGFYPPA